MPPRDTNSEPTWKPNLVNVAGRGLGYRDRDGIFRCVSNLSIKCVAPISLLAKNLKGFVFAAKYNCPGQDSQDNAARPVPFFVRNRSLKVLQSFTESMDDQTDQPSFFRDVSKDMWSRFINKQVESVLSRPFPTLNFAVATGLQHNLYKSTHQSCFFVWNNQLALDYTGKPLATFRFLWYPTLSPKPLQPAVLKPVMVELGPDYLFDRLLRVYTPFNFFPYMLGLCAAILQFYGFVLRQIGASQNPTWIFLSESKGKSQGKSYAARAAMWLTSSERTHRIDPSQKASQIKKTAHHTSLPLCIEDIQNDVLFNELVTSRYDSSMIYTTNASGDTIPVAEYLMSANKLPGVKQERTNDRLGACVFRTWGKISAKEKTEKEVEFEKLMGDHRRPFGVLLGTFGKFIHSKEYKDMVEANLTKIHNYLGIVKLRTCRPYAQLYSLAEFIFDNFTETVEVELGFSKDGLWEYFHGPHASAIRSIHVEQDHAVNNIRRWLVGLLEFVAEMPPNEVLQIFRITKSDKIEPAGYCIAVSHDVDEFDCLNHAAKSDILKQLKEVGGNPRQHAALLKEGCEDETATVGKNTSSRSCLLIPVSCLNDDLIVKCCDATNSQELYFLCDVETPGGVSENRELAKDLNSTAAIGASSRIDPNLSMIPVRTEFQHFLMEEESDEESNDEADETNENQETRTDAIRDPLMFEASDFLADSFKIPAPVIPNNKSVSVRASDRSMSSLRLSESESSRRQSMKGPDSTNKTKPKAVKKPVKRLSVSCRNASAAETSLLSSSRLSRTVNVPGTDRIVYKCDVCGSVSSNKSGFTRHKCQNSSKTSNTSNLSSYESTVFKCDKCEKVCVSLVGLKRHKSLKHGKEKSANNSKNLTSDNVVQINSKEVIDSSVSDSSKSMTEAYKLKRTTRSKKVNLASQ